MKLPLIPLVVLDTETTGFLPKVNRVIEYAHMVVRDGEVTDECEELISIPGEIPDVVSVLTRIQKKDIEGKPTFDDVRETFLKQMGEDTLIVGQNTGFDLRMLRGEGMDLTERPWIDTSMLASLVFPELESYSLGYISKVLHLDHEPVHRALGDVRATLQLLSRCWERLLELPEDMQAELKEIFGRSTEGYRMLAKALPAAKAKTHPKWIAMPRNPSILDTKETLIIEKPPVGTVDLVEEPLDPTFLEKIIRGAVKDDTTVHWIAVKNVTAIVRRLSIPDGVRVLQPPYLLLDPEAVDALSAQKELSADEATLLLKLRWYEGTVMDDFPVHGDEKAVWSGKLACTEKSPTYRKQFQKLPSVVLIDHRQLLTLLAAAEYDDVGAFGEGTHVIIDDASMLEDTATRAYGWYCDIGDLRAAAHNDDELTRLTDLLQLWAEKTRNTQDIRYLTPQDLKTPEAKALIEQVEAAAGDAGRPAQTARLLGAVKEFLEIECLPERIAWIETRQDGSQFVQSVPQSVALLLKHHLYNNYSTTLLIPPGTDGVVPEVIPPGSRMKLNLSVPRFQKELPVNFPENRSARDIICDPPDGKSIILCGSRRIIEQFFVEYTEDLENQGVTLICQNLSGGLGRMQAEFLAASTPAIWILTPWTFEGIDLPTGTVGYLGVDTLPFDHPSHAVFGRRAERYRDGFTEYSMPRLLHRLFRVLRTFRSIATEDALVELLDKRLHEKRYGNQIRTYMKGISSEIAKTKGKKSTTDYPENWQMNLF